MKNISAPEKFRKTYNLPYLLGVYLAANAVPDAAVMVDGLNCVMQKVDFIAGNHDLYSTLLSCDGRHRVVCTMTGPLPQQANPEQKLSALLESAAGSGRYGVVILTGLPFMKLIGMDYEGIASGVRSGAPVAVAPPLSMEGDWLDGYAKTLDALVSVLPVRRVRKARRSAVIAGYLFDSTVEDDEVADQVEQAGLLAHLGQWPVQQGTSGERGGVGGARQDGRFPIRVAQGIEARIDGVIHPADPPTGFDGAPVIPPLQLR